MFAINIFSRTLAFRYKPVNFRSSVSKAMPPRMASAGELILTGFPPIWMDPPRDRVTPKTASISSVRPAPIRPATPRISPRLTWKLTLRNPLPLKFCTSRKTEPNIGYFLVKHIGQRPADHLFDEDGIGQVRGGIGA